MKADTYVYISDSLIKYSKVSIKSTVHIAVQASDFGSVLYC